MKVVERKETDLVPHFKLEFTLDERARLRVYENLPSNIRVGNQLVRFAPGCRLRGKNGIEVHIQEVIEVTRYFLWCTLAPDVSVGTELEVL